MADNALGCTLRAGMGAWGRWRDCGHGNSLSGRVLENGGGIAVCDADSVGAAVVQGECLKESVLSVGHGRIV